MVVGSKSAEGNDTEPLLTAINQSPIYRDKSLIAVSDSGYVS